MNLLQNKVQLIGIVGTAPQIKTLKSGERKAEFRLATDRFYKNINGEKVKETEWHSIVIYGQIVGVIERFVPKGKEIGITGKLSTQIFEGKDGIKHFFTKVICNELILLGNYNRISGVPSHFVETDETLIH